MTDFSSSYQALVDRALLEAEQEADRELSKASLSTMRRLGFTDGSIIAEYSKESVEKYIAFKKKEAVENLNRTLLESISSDRT